MRVADSSNGRVSVDNPVVAARGTVYGTLAGLFEEPDQTVYEKLADGSIGADIQVLVDHAALDVPAPALITDDQYDLLCARFNDVFEIGYPDPPVPLYESEYVEEGTWDDVNLDLARAYDFFGVTIDESDREHHDHLQLELEFAGYLARLAATTRDESVTRARRDFLERHLEPFLVAIAAAVDEEVETGIYHDLTSFAASFARAYRSDLESKLNREVSPS